MTQRLRPFGEGGSSHTDGFTLGMLVGHLEDLEFAESQSLPASGKGPRNKRYDLICEGLSYLQLVLEKWPEDEDDER